MNLLSRYFPTKKKIPIDKFISNALYNKNHGYYSKRIPFGKSGDFITAPGITSLFSELIAIWIISLWEHLGKPKTFNIIELGPGDGRMCRTLIRVFEKFPTFSKSAKIFLYEKSEALKKVQKKKSSR